MRKPLTLFAAMPGNSTPDPRTILNGFLGQHPGLSRQEAKTRMYAEMYGKFSPGGEIKMSDESVKALNNLVDRYMAKMREAAKHKHYDLAKVTKYVHKWNVTASPWKLWEDDDKVEPKENELGEIAP